MRRKLLFLTVCLCLSLAFLPLGHRADAQWQPCTEDDTRSLPSGTCCPEPFGRGMNHYICQGGLWVQYDFSCEQGWCVEW